MSVNLGKKAGLVEILIDPEDEWILEKYSWHFSGIAKLYLRATVEKGKRVQLHRFLLDVTDPKIQVDHRNGNTWDFRKENLRACTHQENCYNKRFDAKGNKTGFKGVEKHIHERKKPFFARLTCKGVTYFLGYYETAIEAAIAYNIKAIEIFGEFASLNPIPQASSQ